jgi:hypothetical protein
MFANVEQVKESMRGKPGAPASEQELEREAQEMVEFAQSDQYEITTNHGWAVGMAIRMAFEVAPILAGRNWVVVHRQTEKKSFVTSDAPVVLSTVVPRETSFWGVGFGNNDAFVAFPLTAACALTMFGSEGTLVHREIRGDAMRHMNLAVASRCQRFVIGREEALVRSLADRLGLASKQWQPKMQRR